MVWRAVRRREQSHGASTGGIPEPDDGLVRSADGWLFRQKLVDRGKGANGRCRKCADGPGHGPYWYRYRWSDGKMHKRYVGKRLPWEVGGHSLGARPPSGRSTAVPTGPLVV
jgi:hypothetical protein